MPAVARARCAIAHTLGEAGLSVADLDGVAYTAGPGLIGALMVGLRAIGNAVGIRIDGIDVALLSHRTQALGLEIFTSVGIDPTQKRIVSVKSTNHFHAAYGPIASEVIYTDAGKPLRTRIVWRPSLAVGARVEGPAVIEEPNATTLIHPGDVATVSDAGHLVIDVKLS